MDAGTIWSAGPYQPVTETIADIHEVATDRLDPGPGTRWLDLACGTGAVAELAAARGARVTGIDLAPALIHTAKERATRLGLDIEYLTGDCQGLDVADASYDAVSSKCGIMFAPDHAASARELVRVTAPGGRIALVNWTPDPDGVMAMFRVMGRFQAAPPPANPFDWGDEGHVRALLGDAFDLTFEVGTSPLHLASAEDYWDLFATNYGPTRTLVDSLGARGDELRRAWVDRFGEPAYRGNGGLIHEREYLLVLGTRR
jgi:SAM-dependent methyltransferase